MAPLVRQKLPELRRWCMAHPAVARLWLFGSGARGELTAGSDVDLLIEYHPGRTPGLEFFAHQQELEALVGRRVDLATVAAIHPFYAANVWRDRVAVYAHADAPPPLRMPDRRDHRYYREDVGQDAEARRREPALA